MRPRFRLLASTAGSLWVLLAGGRDLLAQADGGRPLDSAMTPPGIEFSVEQKLYHLGETILFVLTNESDGYGHTRLCAITMEREGAEGWERVPRRSPDPNRLPITCVDMGIALPPGRSFVMLQPVIPEMEAGVYRFRSDRVDWRDIQTVFITNEFRVVR